MSDNDQVHKSQVLYLNDKSKDKKKESNFAVKKINNNEKISHRADAYGTLINHKNRRYVKVTFRDKVDDNHGDLTEIINIESYKQYNYMETISKLSEREAFAKERSCCSCFIV